MVLISSTTSPIRLAAFDNSLTRSLVLRAWSTASVAIRADFCTWRLISLTEDAISSVADATDCTLVEASSEAAATAVVSSCARSAVEVSVPAATSSSPDADETVSTILPTAASKPSASLFMSALRWRATTSSCLILSSASSRAFSAALTLKPSTACAMSPTSSLRSSPGSTTPKLPPASSFMPEVRPASGANDAARNQERDRKPEQHGDAGNGFLQGNRGADAACGIGARFGEGFADRDLDAVHLLDARRRSTGAHFLVIDLIAAQRDWDRSSRMPRHIWQRPS